jgi:hypothetical protein
MRIRAFLRLHLISGHKKSGLNGPLFSLYVISHGKALLVMPSLGIVNRPTF